MHRELDRSSPISSKILGFTHASRTGNSLLARKKGTFETKLRWGGARGTCRGVAYSCAGNVGVNSWLATRSAMLRDRGVALQNRPRGAVYDMRDPRQRTDAQLQRMQGAERAERRKRFECPRRPVRNRTSGLEAVFDRDMQNASEPFKSVVLELAKRS